MSAKILYSLSSDENPKQLGCINGFFQHFLGGRVVNAHAHHHHHQNSLLQGQAKMETKEGKEVTNKAKKSSNKEIASMVSNESSSMASSSSSSASSSLSPCSNFASINNSHKLSVNSSRKKHIISNVMVHIDSPRPLQPSNHQNQKLPISMNTPPRTHRRSSSVDVKEKKPHARRLSFDGRESDKSNFKVTDQVPRLSLDSRQGRVRSASVSTSASEFRSEFLQEEPGSNRAVSSIVAKLMGLDDLPPATPKSNTSSRRSTDLDLASRSPRSTEESDTEIDRHSVSIYKEIDKRLGDLDFKASSKDLRALKHILEAMQRTKPKTEIQPEESMEETFTKRGQYDEQKSGHKGVTKQESLPRVRTRQDTNAKPHVEHKDLPPKIKTPPQKFDKLEKFSQERRSRSVFNVITSKQDTKSAAKQSMRKKIESTTKKVVDQRELVHTPRPSQKLHKSMVSMNEESMVIVKEQPSPVSVLEADFFDDESLSPIKKKATPFRDGHDGSPVLAQDEWITEMDTNQFSNNTRSSLSCYVDDENDLLTSLIAKDLAKSWTDFRCENSWLVLDIERLIFKDLIVEMLHG